MYDIERVPDPQIIHGTRASQPYKDQFLGQLDQAYAEGIITSEEREARAAHAHREGVSVEGLQNLTRDLPAPAETWWPTPKVRVILYILAAAFSAAFAIAAPVGIVSIHATHVLAAITGILAVFAALLGIAGAVITVFLAFNDDAINKEFGS